MIGPGRVPAPHPDQGVGVEQAVGAGEPDGLGRHPVQGLGVGLGHRAQGHPLALEDGLVREDIGRDLVHGVILPGSQPPSDLIMIRQGFSGHRSGSSSRGSNPRLA